MRVVAKLATASLFAVSALIPSGARAQIDQNQPLASSAVLGYFYHNEGMGQTFKQSSDNIYGAGIFIGQPQGVKSGNVTISLWSAVPGQLGATQLASGTAFATSNNWVDVFWSSVAVTPGQTYFLDFHGTNTNFMAVAGSTANPYADGTVYANGYQTSNGPISFANFDFTFRTYGVPDAGPPSGTVTPEPVTMTLLGTGLAGVAAARRRRKASAA